MTASGAAWGLGKALRGQEAARIAAERALEQTGTAHPVAAIVLSDQEFDLENVVASLVPLMPKIPLWGFSTTGVLTVEGEQPHGVAVMILCGQKINAQTFLFTEKSERGETKDNFLQAVDKTETTGVLLAGDGYSGFDEGLVGDLTKRNIPVCGALASGISVKGKTSQVGGEEVVRGAISALLLGGRFRVASGIGSGWKSTGKRYRVTNAEGFWVDELDGKTPAACYAEAFGYPAREWAFSPLKELVRLYPLGVQPDLDEESLSIHTPLWVEVDGRLRVNLPMEKGKTAHLMIGDRKACQGAVEQAVQMAISQLGNVQPTAAMVWMDTSWQMLFEGQVNHLLSVVSERLPNVPVLGAYTFGQLSRGNIKNEVKLYNQCLEIVLIGMAKK